MLKYSKNYQNLFDSETGYMRARDVDGNFRPDFSPYSWGRDYAECSAIQASLGVLHDISGLSQLMGGKEAFSNYLWKLVKASHFWNDGLWIWNSWDERDGNSAI